MNKIILFFISLFILGCSINGQSQSPFEVEIDTLTVEGLPGIHSYSFGIDDQGRWLIIGGRIDGLHRRQPWASFWEEGNNKRAIVVDINEETVWSAELNVLQASLFEQLQSTNQQFSQIGNTLFITGGYGYSATADDHITYPYLTAIRLNDLTDAIVNGTDISPWFYQIEDPKMAVTGGYLGVLDSIFYLAGGHYFEGRYNPMGPTHGPGFIQEYTNAIRTFEVAQEGATLYITNFNEWTDTVNLHRRDYNMAPQIFADGTEGFTMFSGVFQYDVDLPFLNTVDIRPTGYAVRPDFNQYLSQYHSAHFSAFDEEENEMHHVFFGGLSQYNLDENGNLVEDENVPFVRTISRVTRFADDSVAEVKLDIEMPGLLGAGAAFIPAHTGFSHREILDINQVEGRELIGYIFGGIESSQENIFFINDGTQSIASNTVFKVYMNKTTTSTKNISIKSGNVFNIQIYPNPTVNYQLITEFDNPKTGEVELSLFSFDGKKVQDIFKGNQPKGNQQINFQLENQLTAGVYFLTIQNGEYRCSKKLFVE